MSLKNKIIAKGGRLKDSRAHILKDKNKSFVCITTQLINGTGVKKVKQYDSKSKIQIPIIKVQKKDDVVIPTSITMTEKTTPVYSRKPSYEDLWATRRHIAFHSSNLTPPNFTSSQNSPNPLSDKKLTEVIELQMNQSQQKTKSKSVSRNLFPKQ